MGDSNWMKIPGQDRGWNNPALHDVDGTMAALASTSPVSQSKVAEYLLTLGRCLLGSSRSGRESGPRAERYGSSPARAQSSHTGGDNKIS